MPINMNNADIKKMEIGVFAVVEAAMAQGKTRAFVDTREFFAAMKFSNLRYKRFAEEIGDFMSCRGTYERLGEWLFTEYGDGYSVFIQLTPKGEPGSLEYHAQRDDTFFVRSKGTGLTNFISLSHMDEMLEVDGKAMALDETHPRVRSRLPKQPASFKQGHAEPIEEKPAQDQAQVEGQENE